MVAGEGHETRETLLRHARDLFVEVGPANVSLREVARRTKVSAAAVYRHFDGREALLAAVCEQGFRVFSSYLLRSLGEKTPMARLRASGDLYRRFALENPRDYRVIFMSTLEDAHGRTPSNDALVASSTFRFLVDRVSECIESGDLAAGDPTELAAVIWSQVHGLVSLRLVGQLAPVGDDAAFAKFFRSSTDRLLKGLAP